MVARFVIVALLVPWIVLGAFATPLGKPVYDAGLLLLNSVTDPTERTFWVDPNYREVPRYEGMPDRVFVETDDGIQVVDTTTEAGRDLAYWGINTDLGEKYLRTLGLLLNGPAMILAGLGTASRLMGITRAPPSISGRPGLFDGLSGRTRIGLIVMALGFVSATVGTLFGDLLDEIFDDRLYYIPGEGVNREAQGVAFSMLFLYKAKWLGYMAWSLGIILLLIGTPRRQLFAWFDRRALNGGRWFDPILKKTGVWLFSVGILGEIVQYTGVAGFFAGIRREILLMTTGDMKVLYEEPEWLLTLYAILDLWVLPILLGMILFGAGSKTVRMIIAFIRGMAGQMGSGSSGPTSTSATTPQAGSSDGGESSRFVSGGAARASQAAQARRRGGRGGRGR